MMKIYAQWDADYEFEYVDGYCTLKDVGARVAVEIADDGDLRPGDAISFDGHYKKIGGYMYLLLYVTEIGELGHVAYEPMADVIAQAPSTTSAGGWRGKGGRPKSVGTDQYHNTMLRLYFTPEERERFWELLADLDIKNGRERALAFIALLEGADLPIMPTQEA